MYFHWLHLISFLWHARSMLPPWASLKDPSHDLDSEVYRCCMTELQLQAIVNQQGIEGTGESNLDMTVVDGVSVSKWHSDSTARKSLLSWETCYAEGAWALLSQHPRSIELWQSEVLVAPGDRPKAWWGSAQNIRVHFIQHTGSRWMRLSMRVSNRHQAHCRLPLMR